MNTIDKPAAFDAGALYGAIDRFDADAFGACFAEDATYVFSNYPAVHGREDIVAGAVAFWESVETIDHEVIDLIEFDGGVVSQLEIAFGVGGGRVVRLPVAVITRATDGLITDHRIYVNESPLAGEA